MNKLCFSRLEGSIGYPVGEYVFQNLPTVKKYAEQIINDFPDSHDETLSIWCRGSSGSIISGLLISFLESHFKIIYINHVKKEGEHSHCGNNDFRFGDYNIIVDDMIASGETILSIIQSFKMNLRHTLADKIKGFDGLYVTGSIPISKILDKLYLNNLNLKRCSGSALDSKRGTFNQPYCEFDIDNNDMNLLKYQNEMGEIIIPDNVQNSTDNQFEKKEIIDLYNEF